MLSTSCLTCRRRSPTSLRRNHCVIVPILSTNTKYSKWCFLGVHRFNHEYRQNKSAHLVHSHINLVSQNNFKEKIRFVFISRFRRECTLSKGVCLGRGISVQPHEKRMVPLQEQNWRLPPNGGDNGLQCGHLWFCEEMLVRLKTSRSKGKSTEKLPWYISTD